MVHIIDEEGNILGNIYADIPLPVKELRSLVGRIGGQDSVDEAFLISLVKAGKSVGEHTEGGQAEYPPGAPAF